MRRISLRALLAVTLAFLTWPPPDHAQVKRPLSVADVIQMRRVTTGLGQPVLISPDQRRYVLLLLQGDLRRNGSWIDILCGSTFSTEKAAPRTKIGRAHV